MNFQEQSHLEMQSPPYEDCTMHPEFSSQQPQASHPTQPLEEMFHAMLLQMNNTNQALMAMLSNQQTTRHHQIIQPPRRDTKVRPKPYAGLPTEDVLTWIDHFENVAKYHQWNEERMAAESSTLFENIAATWFVQQSEATKESWQLIKTQLIENFAHQDVAQTALQQLQHLRQQHQEPVSQFGVKLNQLLRLIDPKMSDKMKLFSLWLRLRYDLIDVSVIRHPKHFTMPSKWHR